MIEFEVRTENEARYIRCLSCNQTQSVAGPPERRDLEEKTWKAEHQTGHKLSHNVLPPIKADRRINELIGSMNSSSEFI